jgi:branched-chain amino acid transport system substrate-binding protein
LSSNIEKHQLVTETIPKGGDPIMRLKTPVCQLAVFLLATACSREPIPVGFVGGLTGAQSDLAVQGRNGAELAVGEINAAGGIFGHPLVLLVEDDRNTPEGARQAVERLHEAGVVAIIGPMTSSQTLAALEAAGPAGLLLISPTASSEALVGKKDNLIRMAASNSGEARILAAEVRKDGVGRIAVLRDTGNDSFTRTFTEGFTSVFTAGGGTIVNVVEYAASADTDFGSLAESLLEGDPDGILFVTAALDNALTAQHLRLKGNSARFYASGWSHTSDALIPRGGKAVEGLKMVTRSSCGTEWPRYRQFESGYRLRYGIDPSNPAEYAFEAVWFLAGGLKATRGKPGGLIDALLAPGDQEGLQGRYSMDPLGDPVRQLCVLVIRGGVFEAHGFAGD